MKLAPKSVLFLAAAAFAAVLADPASAERSNRRPARARSVVAADATSIAAGAKLVVRMVDASNDRWEFRMDLRHAPVGLAPEAWIADASGTLAPGGTFTTIGRRGIEYRLRLRGRRGGTLPVGAATLTELSGRAFEVRDAGVAIVSGNLPSLSAAAGSTSTSTSGGGSVGGGADDGPTHEAGEHAGGHGGQGGDDGAGHR